MPKNTEGIHPEKIATWTIVEEANIARNEAVRGSEDGLLRGPECYGVLDGVSSGNGNGTIDGLTAGQFAVQVGIKALQEAARTVTRKEDIVPYVTKRVREAAREKGFTSVPSFVFAAYFPRFRSIIRVGDCTFEVDGKMYPGGMLFDDRKADVHARIINDELRAGATVEDIRERNPSQAPLREITKTIQPSLANAESTGVFGKYTYGVINGNEVPRDHITYEHVPHAMSIRFWTDGYLPGSHQETHAATEKALAEMLEKDPLAIKEARSTRLPQPTHVDDRAALTIVRGKPNT